MQYGVELYPYQRFHKKKKEEHKKKKEEHKKNLDFMRVWNFASYFFMAILISRVMMIEYMAPFGVAFLLSIVISTDERISFVAGLGTIIGYISLYGKINGLGTYIFASGTIIALNYLLKKMNKRKKTISIFISIFIVFAVFPFLIYKLTIKMAVFAAFFEVVCIIPLYFILQYAILCFKNIKTRHLFLNEEIICMAITASLMVSGTWGISVFQVSIRNVIGFLFILIISFIRGAGAGAASGIAMGFIIGIGTENMIVFISIYGASGMITGVFKESGKWLSGMAYFINFCILKIYSNIGPDFKIVEAIICTGIFFIIPRRMYQRVALEFDDEKKYSCANNDYVEKTKKLLVKKLDNFSDVLYNMGEILNGLVDNNKLMMKSKSSALIENLADRVCAGCDMNAMCWKREIHHTYAAFGELIESYQQKKNYIPHEIERKCIKRTILIKNTEEIMNQYIIGEMWRNRLSEGRELLVNQLKNIAGSVEEITEEFHANIQFNTILEDRVQRVLDKNKINYYDVVCYNNRRNKIVIKLCLDACGGRQRCIKSILPLFNEVSGKIMCVGDTGCSVDPSTGVCNVVFEEMPKFHVSSYAARQCKEGEKENGDSYTSGKIYDGAYMNIISDGMGSGPLAEKESQATIELIEKISNAGFSKMTAIHTVNSIMSIKFSESENFSTVDLSCIDLYEGEVEFMKVGAVASFIKRENKIEVIKSKTLPIGVLDKADIDVIRKNVKSGEVIVMVSDGVLDYNSSSLGKEEWIVEYLKTANGNPKEIAQGLIEKAKELSGGKVRDDMTIIVSKIYQLEQ